jgi:hypothetical protein
MVCFRQFCMEQSISKTAFAMKSPYTRLRHLPSFRTCRRGFLPDKLDADHSAAPPNDVASFLFLLALRYRQFEASAAGDQDGQAEENSD